MMDDAHLFFGGDVHTVDDERPSAEAVAVCKGRIVAVGKESECRAALPRDFAETNLRGRALLPGFIDTHLHPVPLAYFDMNVDLREVASMPQLREFLQRASPVGGWVVGLQFDENASASLRLPTRHDLDEVTRDWPVVVLKHDGHTAVGNSAALAAAGVDVETLDPQGGVVERESDGKPSGVFREAATRLLLSAVPVPEMDAFAAGAARSFRRLVGCGITSAGVILQTGDEGPAGAQGAFDVALVQAWREHIPISLYGILIASDLEPVRAALSTPLHEETEGAARRIGAVKMFADGTFGSCTACMREPFSDEPGKRGFMTLTDDEIYRRMELFHGAGLQLAIHAIGDEANRRCIGLYEKLLREHPRPDHRHRLEHASLLDGEMIADLARLRLVVSTQPLFIHSEKTWLHRRLGSDRAAAVYPLRSLLDAGVVVAGASDAPVESPDVLHAIQCCVTREGFEVQQGITAAEAVRLYTLDAARAQFEETCKGSIRPGKRADLVVLSDNPTRVEARDISCIQVECTMVGGRPVHGRAV
jgi:predicted amidohydrolase YtcJ